MKNLDILIEMFPNTKTLVLVCDLIDFPIVDNSKYLNSGQYGVFTPSTPEEKTGEQMGIHYNGVTFHFVTQEKLLSLLSKEN